MYVRIPFSELTLEGCVGYKILLWSYKPCPASYCLVTVVCIVPVSANTPGIYAFPGWNFALYRRIINSHMQYSLNLTYLIFETTVFDRAGHDVDTMNVAIEALSLLIEDKP